MFANLVKGIAIRFLKGKWGSLLPMLLTSAAEGDFGPGVQKVYRALEGKKTVTGMLLLALGTGCEAIAGSFPDQAPWAAPTARFLYAFGGILASVGLVDGGVRAPWPKGTQIPVEAKKG